MCRRALPYLAVGNLFLEGVFKVQSVGHLLIEAWERGEETCGKWLGKDEKEGRGCNGAPPPKVTPSPGVDVPSLMETECVASQSLMTQARCFSSDRAFYSVRVR